MERFAEPAPRPLVSLKQAVTLAKHHTWGRVGFTIGVLAYAMAVLIVSREVGMADWLTMALYAGGSTAIGAAGFRWHNGAKRTIASASVVDESGRVLGRADHVAKEELAQRSWPFALALVAWWVVSMPLDLAFPSEDPTWWKGLICLGVALLVWQRARTVQRRSGARAHTSSSLAGHKTAHPRQVMGDDAPI